MRPNCKSCHPLLRQRAESGLGAFDILFNRTATDTDCSDHPIPNADRQAAAKGHDARNMRHPCQERRIILNKVKKLVRRHPKKGGVGFVLRHLDTD